MKKFFRIFCAVVCVAVLMSGFCLQSFAVRANTKDYVRLYGDIDGNGVIEQSDFDYILGVATGEIEMPAIGSPEYYAADIMGDGITMEDARRCYRLLNGLDEYETYSPAEREVDLFNNLVNFIKSENFTDHLIYYSYDYDFMETKNIDFGAFTSIIKDALAEEDTETTTYSRVYVNNAVRTYENSQGGVTANFPAFNRTVGSDLTLADIQDFSIEIGVPCSFSKDINVPASFVANGKTYNLSALSDKEKSFTDCIKITIEVKEESYYNVPANVRELAKKQLAVGYQMAEGEVHYRDLYTPAMYKLYGSDIIEIGSQYPLEQIDDSDGLSTRIKAELNELTMGGSVVFYFDRATLNPICASYTAQTDITQKVAMEMAVASFSLSGTMAPRNVMITQNNYWFYDYFSDVASTITP